MSLLRVSSVLPMVTLAQSLIPFSSLRCGSPASAITTISFIPVTTPMDSKDVYQDWKSQSVAVVYLRILGSFCTPRMAASPNQFLIIVGLFTCYIGTAPELESTDRCRAA